MCRILILVDIKPMGYNHAVVVFALGKNLLFKSVLGHCDLIRVGRSKMPKKSDVICEFVLANIEGEKFEVEYGICQLL